MTWIYLYEPEVIEVALERLMADGIVIEDVAVYHDGPVPTVRDLIYDRRDFRARRSRMMEVEPVRSVLGWLRG